MSAHRFAIRKLSVLAYAAGFTQWYYKHPGSLAGLYLPGFFDAAAEMIKPGDHIHVSATDGGTIFFVPTVKPSVIVVKLS